MDGFVDSASLYELVNFFRTGNESPAWARQVSHELSTLFIASPRVHIMPGFRVDGTPSDAYGTLILQLQDRVGILEVGDATTAQALRRTRRWSSERASRIREVLDGMHEGTFHDGREDYASFTPWLTNFFEHNAVEHARRLEGTFNRILIPQLSKILDIPSRDLDRVWLLGCDAKFLRRPQLLDRTSSEPVQIMWDAVAAAALIRGRFHDGVAELARVQVIHHPVRSPVLKALGPTLDAYGGTRSQEFLAAILLNSALREKGLDARIAAWASSLEDVRRQVHQDNLDLTETSTLEQAERQAVDAARSIGIRRFSGRVTQGIELVAALGVGTVTSFTLSPWEGAATAMATSLASRVPQVQQVLSRPERASRKQLRLMAQARSGRLTRR